MPELPEVEIVKRGLEPLLVGSRFVAVERRRTDLRVPFPPRFVERLVGVRILSLARRAKYILARLGSGEILVMHLGMTGRFTVSSGKEPAEAGRVLGAYVYDPGGSPRHDHVRFALSGGAIVTYNDPRRFGLMDLVAESELETHPMFAELGTEPLGNGLDAGYLAERARGRRSDLKAFLMDQRIVAGLGNIYVCESLHRAGLSPRRAAGTLTLRSGRPAGPAERLVPEIRNVLTAAILAGGSTLRDYRHADGRSGAFQEAFSVYDREGEPCLRRGCGGTVRRIVQAGRSTFYCPRCQR